jgi:hypothetical protein
MSFDANQESADFFIAESERVIKLYRKCEDGERKDALRAQLVEIKRRLELEKDISDEDF